MDRNTIMDVMTMFVASLVGGLIKLGSTPGGGRPTGISDNGTPEGIDNAMSAQGKE